VAELNDSQFRRNSYFAMVLDPTAFPLAGRDPQKHRLQVAVDSGRPELIAVLGRRRVGKTHLVRTFFEKELCFELTGSRDGTLQEQLVNFANSLGSLTGYRHARPESWQMAFEELIRALEPMLSKGGRRVLFFDELPWLAGRNSRFLPAFEHFWNHWASRQKRLIVVVCGSAASWMITKFLRHKGGLHNRVTRRILLEPFTLSETEQFLETRKINWDRPQIVEFQMAMGGIPFYLNLIERGDSPAQSIQKLLFAKGAPLANEFEELYASLFEHHERHLAVIHALAQKQQGLSRNEIQALSGIPGGGNLTTILEELETSGFILKTVPFGRTQRDRLYRLVDEFSLFYLKWHNNKSPRKVSWLSRRNSSAYQAWSGYAFENLCLRHLWQLKAALGISGVETEASAWRYQPKSPDEKGAQIDLLIDRKDGIVNLCEMKYTDVPFTIEKSYAENLRGKREIFRQVTKIRKSLLLTMVTPCGLKPNTHAHLADSQITMDALFVPLPSEEVLG